MSEDSQKDQGWLKRHRGTFVTAACVSLVVLVGLAVWRWRDASWGDVPTWLTFAAAALGIPFAIFQFADRQREILNELERRRKEESLLDEQLKQVDVTNRVLRRQQAEKVDFRPGSWKPPVGTTDQFGNPMFGEAQHVATVVNDSARPIRYVSCVLANDITREDEKAIRVGKYTSQRFNNQGVMVLVDTQPGESVEVIRAGQEYGFVFARLHSALSVRMGVTFTDDAGLRWRIDHDLSLTQLLDPPAAGEAS